MHAKKHINMSNLISMIIHIMLQIHNGRANSDAPTVLYISKFASVIYFLQFFIFH